MNDIPLFDEKSRLEDRIKKAYKTLGELEDQYDNTRNPLDRNHLRIDIDQQKELIKEIQQELISVQDKNSYAVQQQSLDSVIQNLPFDSNATAPLFTVNCNRKIEYDRLAVHFEQFGDADRNLFYLISACDSQKPDSLAKRLIYEFVKSHRVLYFSQPDSPYVDIINLLLTRQHGESWNQIWKSFNEYFHKEEEDKSDFDSFIQRKAPWRTGTYRIALTFFIDELYWNSTDPCGFIQYVLDQFARIPEGRRRFMVFFICDFSAVHCNCSADQKDQLKRLKKLVENNSLPELTDRALLHLPILPPVAEKEVEKWVKAVLDKNKPRDPRPVIQALRDSLKDEEECSLYQEKNEYDMRRVEEMQNIIHQTAKKQYLEKKQKSHG